MNSNDDVSQKTTSTYGMTDDVARGRPVERRTPHHNPPNPEPPVDRSDAVVVTWTPRSSPPRRLVFEPRSDGDWTRYDQALDPEEVWRTRGTEIVSAVGVELGGQDG